MKRSIESIYGGLFPHGCSPEEERSSKRLKSLIEKYSFHNNTKKLLTLALMSDTTAKPALEHRHTLTTIDGSFETARREVERFEEWKQRLLQGMLV